MLHNNKKAGKNRVSYFKSDEQMKHCLNEILILDTT